VKIDTLADLHGHFPKLEGGDLLIIAGDLTAHHTQEEFDDFDYWLAHQNYTKKIFIGGNHDTFLINEKPKKYKVRTKNFFYEKFEYLCDSGTEFKGLNIWGSPWTKTFNGINPSCTAFTVNTDEELSEKWDLIPEDTEILITHGPPLGIYDRIKRTSDYVGSKSLRCKIDKLKKLKLLCFGHIHECGCRYTKLVGFDKEMHVVNASYLDENYAPINNAIRIVL
jgi:Icc-related predicted phosphoesterase